MTRASESSRPSAARQVDTVSWDALRLVLALEQEGSTAAAARRLGISQSTASRNLAEVEHRLRMQLFQRKAHGLSLTPEAQQLIEPLRRMHEAAQDAMLRAQRPQHAMAGTLRIRTTEGLASLLLPQAAVALRELSPEVHVEVEIDNRDDDRLAPPVDLALLAHRPEGSQIVRRRLARWDLVVAAHVDIVARHGAPSGWSQLSQLPWLGFDRLNLLDELMRKIAGSGGPSARTVFRSDSHWLRIQALRAGLGVTIVPGWIVRQDPALTALVTTPALPVLEVWLATSAGIARRPLIRAAFDVLTRIGVSNAPGRQPTG